MPVAPSCTCRSPAWIWCSVSVEPERPSRRSIASAVPPGSAPRHASRPKCATWRTNCSTLRRPQDGRGFAFSPDSNWQREFEDGFEFTETRDQLTAIKEIKRDMESPQPMDRLLCGDVGFGKTEVVMRAAFKALGDGRQVVILAPTTILAFQTFRNIQTAFSTISGARRDVQPLPLPEGTQGIADRSGGR